MSQRVQHRRHRCHWAALLLLAALLAPPAAADGLVPLPPQPNGVAWPTDEWPVGALPADLDLEAFDASVEALFAAKGRGGYGDTRALLVVQGGQIVFEIG